MRTSPVRVARLVGAAVLAVGATLAAAPGVASAAPAGSPAQIVWPVPFPQGAANEGEYYYPNYFYSEYTCQARGRAITNPRSPEYIPGAVTFRCVKRPGGTKWSMQIVWR